MKRSNLFSVLSALVMLVMFLASCSKKVDYVGVIPANAPLVVSLDLKSLAEKSGLNDNESAKTKLTDALKSGLNAEALQYMEKVMKDPSESGISLSDKVYIFTTDAMEYQGLVAKVEDLDKLKATFKLLEDQQISMPLEDTGVNGYQLTFLNEKDVACFNESTLLILIGKSVFSSESTEETAKTLIAQTAEQSIASNKGFVQMNNKKGDIAAYVTMDVFPQDYALMAKKSLPEGLDLKDVGMVGTLNFEKGKISLEVESTENELLKDMNKQYENVYSKMNSDFMDCFPTSSLLYMGMNMDGKKLSELLASNKEFQQALEKAKIGDVDLMKIISSIDGEVAYGISAVSAQGMPSMTCYVEVSNDEIVKAINTGFGEMSKQVDDNNYSITMGGGINGYYGMKDKTFYFTLDADVAKNICEKVNEPMSGAKWASTAKKSYVFMVLNIKDALNLPVANMLMAMGGQQAVIAKTVLSQFDYMEISALNTKQAVWNLVMTNQDENALKQLITMGEQFAGNN